MRINIEIAEGGKVTTSVSPVASEGDVDYAPATPADTQSPPADLAARAAAAGARSAGPAPQQPAVSGVPSFPPSVLGTPDSALTDQGGGSATSAGGAPGAEPEAVVVEESEY